MILFFSRRLARLCSALLLTGFSPLPAALAQTNVPDAQVLVDRARAAHGMDRLDRAVVSFDFRTYRFTVTRADGRFSYARTYTDAAGRVREVLTNDALYREVNGRRVALGEAERRRVETGINSVVYFALLPYALNDPAVQKRYLGPATLEGAPYHEIEVTFRPEGGGRDWEDRFVYWIHRDRHTMDYLAYYFHTDGGGSRFRKAVNPRVVGGVRFADYLNFAAAPDTLGAAVETYDALLRRDGLRLVSEIVLENVQVRPLGS